MYITIKKQNIVLINMYFLINIINNNLYCFYFRNDVYLWL